MTATVPIVSPRVPNDPAASSATGPNTVQLTIGFEIASLQLTPALKLGAVQIRPTSNIVSVQLDATSQATLQRLLAGAAGGGPPAFEIDKLELTAGGKIALITSRRRSEAIGGGESLPPGALGAARGRTRTHTRAWARGPKIRTAATRSHAAANNFARRILRAPPSPSSA